MNIYVGNLPYSVTSEDLAKMFEEHGVVDDAQVITDRETGRSKGFGFIEMPDNAEADQAIKAFNGTQLNGRQITVGSACGPAPRVESGASAQRPVSALARRGVNPPCGIAPTHFDDGSSNEILEGTRVDVLEPVHVEAGLAWCGACPAWSIVPGSHRTRA